MTSPTDRVAFFDTTFQEALDLTKEARDYLTDRQRCQALEDATSGPESLVANCEAMRVTSRLTQVMAWLMVQKSVHAGEMTRMEARDPRYRLAGQDVCKDDSAAQAGDLERGLQSLLARSLSLYERVERLDSLYDQ